VERGAKGYGYEEERGTSARLSQVMEEQIGVKKGATTIRRWLKKLGISYQKMSTKDKRHDEKAVKKS
jgi:transposase